MFNFQIKYKLFRRDWSIPDREYGPGYVEDQGVELLLKRCWMLYGVCVWSVVVDREDMPSWAWIAEGCLGSTDWQSRLRQDPRLLK